MESKTKHRMLGIAVVAGLAILIYPFVGSNNLSGEKALVKAPDFPEQATQLAVGDDVVGMPGGGAEQAASIAPPDQNGVTAPQMDTSVKPAASSAPNVVNINDVAVQPKNAAADVPATMEPAEKAAVTTDVQSADPGRISSPIVENKTKAAKIRSLQKKIASKPVKKLASADRVRSDIPAAHSHSRIKQAALSSYKNQPIENNGLMDLKSAVYVIQLGSFKQKSNALRLVNRLRAKGYRAFIQSVDASSGKNTRVFVGPEHQQASARQVASQLNKEMQLHGIVISYKPFTL